MADFKTPNLCGANESLNGALSKISDLKAEIESKLDLDASVASAAIATAQADVKAGLDALAVDLPASKPVNFQSEITSLINNIDRTTVQGLSAYNAKVAQLEQDFGDKLKEKGLELDKLISESSTKLGKDINAVTSALGSAVSDITGAVSSATSSITGAASDAVSSLTGGGTPSLDAFGGAGDAVAGITTPTLPTTGNICDLVPNLEIPANISGTGVTTEEIEERGTYATLTLNQTPKSIVSVTGKKTSQSFFTNIKYTQNGKVIVPTAVGSYSDIKVIYIVDLIKEKPVAAKQADVPAETEEASIVSVNTSAKDTSFAGLIAKFKKDVESAPSKNDVSKDLAGIKSAISFIGSPDYKAKQEKDFATWQTEYKKLKADPLNYKSVVTPKGETIKVTTPEASITKETKTDKDGFTYTETKRVTSSDAGFAARQKDKFVEIVRLDLAKKVLSEIDISNFPDAYEHVEETIEFFTPKTTASSVTLTDSVWTMQFVSISSNIFYNPKTNVVDPAGVQQYDIPEFNGNDIVQRGADSGDNLFYKLDGQTITFRDAIGRPVDPFGNKYIFAIMIGYRTLDKIDPNYKG